MFITDDGDNLTILLIDPVEMVKYAADKILKNL